MTQSQDASTEHEVTLEIVSYDPARRIGFLRIVVPPFNERVHFSLGMLPEAFRASVSEISRALKRDLAKEEFKEAMRRIRRSVTGARLRAVVGRREDGRLRLRKRTVVLLSMPGEGG